jgi:hypothetical protein
MEHVVKRERIATGKRRVVEQVFTVRIDHDGTLGSLNPESLKGQLEMWLSGCQVKTKAVVVTEGGGDGVTEDH